ncbi:MAG TPA: glycosyltransferase family 4 protein [Acidimicrobiia bacterium]|jgi:glycosyltransferase involved in cell wall biosynthesis|nr:glycosyltransferase family 4 protein [Acidimicrobiia bacterium]
MVHRVLILITSDQRRGAEVFGSQMAEGLAARGWEAELLALSSAAGGARVDAEVVGGRDRTRLGRLSPDVVMALRRRVDGFGPGIVFANGGATLRYGIAATRFRRHRPLLVYGSIGEPAHWARTSVSRRLLAAQLRMADFVTAVSATTRDQLLGLGVPPDRIEVTPIGAVPLVTEVARTEDHPELRVLFLGSLTAEKDPLTALETVARAARSVPVRMRVVGGGAQAAALGEEVARHGLAETVELVGVVADVLPHLAWADVLVLTSTTEGLPGAVLEAAFAGVPTAGFDVGGVSEAVIDGSTGQLVPRGDIDALSAVLVEMATDRAVTRAMGEEARRLALSRFTLDDAVDRFAAVFSRLSDQDGPT